MLETGSEKVKMIRILLLRFPKQTRVLPQQTEHTELTTKDAIHASIKASVITPPPEVVGHTGPHTLSWSVSSLYDLKSF